MNSDIAIISTVGSLAELALSSYVSSEIPFAIICATTVLITITDVRATMAAVMPCSRTNQGQIMSQLY